MTPLRALEILATLDAPGLDAALASLNALDPTTLNTPERLQLLAALDATLQALQPQHAALMQRLQHLRTSAQRVRAYQT
jgi:hypothetical protein